MPLLSYNRLVELVKTGIIDAPLENVNGASIDITLGAEILIEDPTLLSKPVDLATKESIGMHHRNITNVPYTMLPGNFILASTNETFNLPPHIACEYKLKSSLARSGLQHMLAGWCDPGWNNSQLTLELKNVTQNHILKLTHGMKIGQMVFFECDAVPEEHSYAKKGQYNNQETVTASKGLR